MHSFSPACRMKRQLDSSSLLRAGELHVIIFATNGAGFGGCVALAESRVSPFVIRFTTADRAAVSVFASRPRNFRINIHEFIYSTFGVAARGNGGHGGMEGEVAVEAIDSVCPRNSPWRHSALNFGRRIPILGSFNLRLLVFFPAVAVSRPSCIAEMSARLALAASSRFPLVPLFFPIPRSQRGNAGRDREREEMLPSIDPVPRTASEI